MSVWRAMGILFRLNCSETLLNTVIHIAPELAYNCAHEVEQKVFSLKHYAAAILA